MVINDIDLRLLRVFCAVVEAGGFSNAQATLNISQSTISTQMSQLETRLGFRLCQRGRSGFTLTKQGEDLYRYAVDLFHSVQRFQAKADEVRGGLSGQLRIGFIDNIIMDPSCPLRAALARFTNEPRNTVRISLEALSPSDLERRLLDSSIDLAISISNRRLPGLQYDPLYVERDVLVCQREHALAGAEDSREAIDAIRRAHKVIRTFLGDQEFPYSNINDGALIADVANIEAAAFLILTGKYIGFLPKHYATPWLRSGEMVELLPGKFPRQSQLFLLTRVQQQPRPVALDTFFRCIELERVRASAHRYFPPNENVQPEQCKH